MTTLTRKEIESLQSVLTTYMFEFGTTHSREHKSLKDKLIVMHSEIELNRGPELRAVTIEDIMPDNTMNDLLAL
jgi:hypothetical protein